MPRRNSLIGSFQRGASNALKWQMDPARILGAGENALSGATAFGTSVVAGPVAAYHAMRSGSTREYGPMYNAIMQRGTYQPRTASGQALQNALSGFGEGYSEAIRRDVEAIPVDRPIARTAARVVGEFAPALIPGISPAVRAVDAMPPTSARMRQAGITNYHGTPHTVDRFSSDRIGTGEGAQVYGHGLYFADSPDVASRYRRELSGTATLDREVQRRMTDPNAMGLTLQRRRGKLLYVNENGQQVGMSTSAKNMTEQNFASSWSANMDYQLSRPVNQIIDHLGGEQSAAALVERAGGKMPGSLYTVDIPDEHIARMLDWDKPIGDQPPHVRDAVGSLLRDIGLPVDGSGAPLMFQRNPTGESIYMAIESSVQNRMIAAGKKKVKDHQPETARMLGSVGIPGIRYLDQGSRGAGKGTSNTVLFDDSLVNITHENGQPRRRPGQ